MKQQTTKEAPKKCKGCRRSADTRYTNQRYCSPECEMVDKDDTQGIKW